MRFLSFPEISQQLLLHNIMLAVFWSTNAAVPDTGKQNLLMEISGSD
jgi:hypothetical protein